MSQKPMRVCTHALRFWLQFVQFGLNLKIYEVRVKGKQGNSLSSTTFVWNYIFHSDKRQQHML